MSRSMIFLALAAASFAASAAPRAPLEPFAGRYDVLRNGEAMGQSTITLTAGADDTWTLRTTTDGTHGLARVAGAHIDERSTFRWHEGTPELVDYRYDQKVGWRSKQRSLVVSTSGDSIAADDGKHRADMPFEAGVQDRHTVVLALAAALARADAEGSEVPALRFRVVEKIAIDDQRFTHAGNESVQVPAGTFDTERIERVREKPGRTTTSWLAPSLGYMPVRIVQREPDGETIEMRLASH